MPDRKGRKDVKKWYHKYRPVNPNFLFPLYILCSSWAVIYTCRSSLQLALVHLFLSVNLEQDKNWTVGGWGEGWWWWSRPIQPKIPRSVQICMGRGVVQTNIPEILEWEHSRNFEHKFCHAILWQPLHHRYSLTHYVCGRDNAIRFANNIVQYLTRLTNIWKIPNILILC